MLGFVEMLIISFIFLVAFLYQKRAKPLPGIRVAPGFAWFFGHSLLIKNMRESAQQLFEWNLKNAIESDGKPFQILVPDRDAYVRIVTPEAVQFMLKDRFDSFLKINNDISRLVRKEFIGKGIFASDGEEWRFQRKVASYMFSTHNLENVMSSTFLQHGETFLGVLKKHSDANECFDIQDLMKRFTMDSICQIAFGVHFDSLLKPVCEFSKAFDRIQELIVRRAFKPIFLFHLHQWLNIGGEKEIKHDAHILNGAIYELLRLRNEKIEKEGHENSRWEDLLSQFILMKKKKGEKLDAEQTRDIVMNFLVAGRDTTACLLTWSLYEISKHPEMEQKILDEMKQVFSDSPVSVESVKGLKYTHNFLCEVLRLHPPVPFNSKKAAEDITFPDGTWVPKDTIIQYSPYVFGRLPHWENAEEFQPERWDKDPNPSEFKFLAFNAGPRICLGKRMAYLEAKILLSLLLPQYKVCVKQDQTFDPVLGLILWFKEGLQVHVQPRS